MELAPYSSLAVIYRSAPELLTVPICIGFLVDIVRGLQFLHRSRLLHRDLKCDNTLVCSGLSAKLADVGLGRMQTKSQNSDFHGTGNVNAPTLGFPNRHIQFRCDDLGTPEQETQFLGDPLQNFTSWGRIVVMKIHSNDVLPTAGLEHEATSGKLHAAILDKI